MPVSNSVIERVFSKINRDEIVNLAMTLSDLHSPTGREQSVAAFILKWFQDNGFRAIKQGVDGERFNAVGILRGTGDGPSLMLNGHMDTMLIPGQPIEKGHIEGGLVYGNEIANMKGGLAALMITAKAIKESGVKLAGDLIIAGVVGEINVGSVGPYQETQDRGDGLGTRYLLANGIQSDYAICCDGSGYSIIRAQPGEAYFKITTTGTVAYTPYTTRPATLKESRNAIVKMTEIIRLLEDWGREFEKKNIYQFPGGPMEPKVSLNCLEAGMPFMFDGWRTSFKPSQSPAKCDLYIDVRVPPHRTPLDIKHEVEGVLRGLPFDWDIEMFRSQKGYEGTGPKVEFLATTIENSYQHVFKTGTPAPETAFCGMWTDTNCFWEIGIPAVKWGITDANEYPSRKVAIIDNLIGGAKVYSLVALEICGK